MAIFSLPSWFKGQQMIPEYVVNHNHIGLVEAIISDVANKTLNLERASSRQLQWLRNVVERARNTEHPFYTKVHEAFCKCQDNSSFNVPKAIDIFTAMQIKEPFIRKFFPKADIPTRFSQGNMTIEEVSAVIVSQGKHLQDLTLTEVNDQLMQLIAIHCKGLIYLSIHQRPNHPPMDFSDKSLESIGELEQLNRLHLDLWESLKISRPALLKLLNKDHLRENLTDLNLSSYQVNDDVLKAISSYRRLETFHAASGSFTHLGIAAFLASTSIRQTMRSLSLNMGVQWGILVTNAVLANLLPLTSLRELTLNGKWKIGDNSLQEILKFRNNLTKLCLTGIAINSKDAAMIGNMADLSELFIGDASALTSEDLSKIFFLNHKQNLRVLGIRKGFNLSISNIFELRILPNLQHLTLSDCGGRFFGECLQQLCDSHFLQGKLRYLEICDNRWVTGKALAEIGKLASLECLRIDNCPQFNNESLKGLIEGPAKDKLRELELSTVAVTNIEMLGALNLTTLMLSNCFSVPVEKWIEFLKQANLKDKLQKLYLNFAVIQPNMVKLFEAFKELRVLIVGNPLELDNQDQKRLDLENLRRNKGRVEVFEGDKFNGWSELING